MNKNVILNYNISEIHKGFENKTIDPVEVVRAYIDRFEKFESKYRAWVYFDIERLIKIAKETKERIQRGELIRPLEGIPVGVKDIFNTVDFPTQMGSPIWKDFTPGNDARVVFYIKNAGGIVAGKTVTAEFAVHVLLNETLNPHNITITPGTSSSGSAVAISLGMVPIAFGTQTAGSIIRPASFCGIYGCKPSFGLIPRTGILKTTDSLDTVGYFTMHFEDLERVFNVIRVHGPNYPISCQALKDENRQSKPNNRPWKVVLAKTHTWKYAEDYAKDAFLEFAKRLSECKDIEIFEIEMPKKMEDSHNIHNTIYDKTLSYYFNREYKRSEFMSSIMKELIERGNKLTIEQYYKALKDQEELCHIVDNFMQNYDIMISLSTAGIAPLREEKEKPDPALMWTLTHLPVIGAPVFKNKEGIPFGIQLVARKYNDLLLFKFAEYLREFNLIPKSTLYTPD